MRKIKITPKLKAEIELFNLNLFANRRSDFELPLSRLKKLRNKLSGNKRKKYKDYVSLIIKDYKKILDADPDDMVVLITEFNKVLSPQEVSDVYPNSTKRFYENVVDAMRYEDLRDKEFPEYLMASEIRTCIYCNSQNALVIEKIYFDKKKRRVREIQAKLQLDHFYPKSKYPFLCTSFYNLYPTCGNCNQAKHNKEALFQLYTYDDDLDIFQFHLDDKSVIKYWMNLDKEELKVKFKTIKTDQSLIKNHNELFQVQAIYDRLNDFGEELVWKAKVNPKIYRETMHEMFTKLFPDKTYIDRAIIGNYVKPEETFKRPMAKYTQDLARQLKLIP